MIKTTLRAISAFLLLATVLSAEAPPPEMPAVAVPADETDPSTTMEKTKMAAGAWSFWGGVDSIPYVRWSPEPLVTRRRLYYTFEAHAFTTYVGSFANEDLGLSFGFQATTDSNLIGNFSEITGFIGYDDYVLRIRTGRLEGSARWKGALATGMKPRIDFDNDYLTLDLIYWMDTDGDYMGVSYSSLTMPMQMDTLLTTGGKTNQYNGITIYDPDYSMFAYSWIIGFDTLYASVLEDKPAVGKFEWFVSTQDSLGIGEATVSRTGARFAEDLNPGTSAVGRRMICGFVEYDLTVGGKYVIVTEGSRTAIGFGYNFGGFMITPWGGAAEESDDVGFEGVYWLLRYGPIFRVYSSF